MRRTFTHPYGTFGGGSCYSLLQSCGSHGVLISFGFTCLMKKIYNWWLSHLVVLKSNNTSHVALGGKQSGVVATLTFGGGVNYIWHVLSASKVLAVAISCIP